MMEVIPGGTSCCVPSLPSLPGSEGCRRVVVKSGRLRQRVLFLLSGSVDGQNTRLSRGPFALFLVYRWCILHVFGVFLKLVVALRGDFKL